MQPAFTLQLALPVAARVLPDEHAAHQLWLADGAPAARRDDDAPAELHLTFSTKRLDEAVRHGEITGGRAVPRHQ